MLDETVTALFADRPDKSVQNNPKKGSYNNMESPWSSSVTQQVRCQNISV